MKVLIVGVGYTGSCLADLLLASDHQVIGIKRNAHDAKPPCPHSLIVGSIHEEATLAKIPTDLDSIVYAVSPQSRDSGAYRDAYPEGLRKILHRTGQTPVFFISSTSVYAQNSGQWLDEESPCLSDTNNARTLREAEDLLLKRGTNDVVVRSSGIYGPGRTRLISQLQRVELPPTAAKIWTNRIHRQDLARALFFLMNQRDEKGIFLASDPNPATLGEMQDWVKAQQELLAPSAVSSEIRFGRKSRRFRSARLEVLGFHYKYPSFREGYLEILDQRSTKT